MSTPVRFLLPAQLHRQMLEQARAELPDECCGALLGRMESGSVCRIERAFPLVNTLASTIEYEADPRGLLQAQKEARRLGLDIVGFYHSHPTSAPIPSTKDRERNYWGASVVHFILSLATEPPAVRAWRLTKEDQREEEWEVVGE